VSYQVNLVEEAGEGGVQDRKVVVGGCRRALEYRRGPETKWGTRIRNFGEYRGTILERVSTAESPFYGRTDRRTCG